jgi:hypothetical protein
LAAASGGKTGAKAETSTTVTTAAPAKPVVSSAPRSTSPTTAGLRVQVRVPQLPHKGHDKGGGGKGD